MPNDLTVLDAGGPVLPVSGRAHRQQPALTARERSYMMLAIFVRTQHLQFTAAERLADAMLALGDDGPDLRFARAVILFRQGRHAEVLAELRELDRIDPADGTAAAKSGERSRFRSYMRAKSCYALTGALDDEGRASLDFYLRRGGVVAA